MAKLTLKDPGANYRSVAQITDNNTAIEAAIENTLSRDGTGPNQMEAELDMNSNKVINQADPTSAQDGATKNYVDGLISTGASNAAAAAASAAAAATSETNAASSETNASASAASAATSETSASASQVSAAASAAAAAASETNASDIETRVEADRTATAASAAAAATSETNAAASASAAATSEANASTSETNAATSASSAATSATSAAASASAAAASFDAFDDRYLGAKATAPTVDNDGDALLDGALYWDTTDNALYVYDLGNTTWIRTTDGIVSVTANEFTGDGSTVAFTISGSPPSDGHLIVTVDGVSQPTSSYSVSGTTLTFTEAPPTDSLVEARGFEFASYSSIDLSSYVTRTGTDTLTNKTIDLDSNTITGTLGEFNTALQGDSFVSLTGTETLTNKTLTSPVLNGTLTGTAMDRFNYAVDDVSAMEALTTSEVSAGDTVQMRGYYAANDAGGGFFNVLSGSASSNALTVDDGIVFENTAGNLTFVRATAPYGDHVAFDTWFGAGPDRSAAENTTAHNNLASWIRSQTGGNLSRETVTAVWAAGGTCEVNTLNYTQIKSFGWTIRNAGTTIKGVQSGKTVLDLVDSRFGSFYNLHIEGDSTNRPAVGISYGIVAMRIQSSSGAAAQTVQSAGNHQFFGCFTSGEFTVAGVHNCNSEEVSYYGCRWENDHTAAAGEDGVCELRDGRGAVRQTSDYVPVRNAAGDCYVITDYNGSGLSTSYTNVWAGVYANTGALPSARQDASALVSGDYATVFTDTSSPTAISQGVLYKWDGAAWNTAPNENVIVSRPDTADGSFVCVSSHQTNWIKDGASTGPAIRFYGPGSSHSFPAGNYVAAPIGEAAITVNLYGGSEVNSFDFSAHVEISGVNYAVHVETDDASYNLGSWRVADHNSFADTALIYTDASAGTIRLVGSEIEVDQFSSGSPVALFSPTARFEMSGKITTRLSSGLTGMPNYFAGALYVPDANKCALGRGSYWIYSSLVDNTRADYAMFKGELRGSGGTSTLADDTYLDSGQAYFEISPNKATYQGTSPGMRLKETDGSTDNKWWEFSVNGELFSLVTFSDSGEDIGSFTRACFKADRSGNMDVSGVFKVDGTQVVGNRGSAIANVPTGGSATAADNATAINNILARMRSHGLIST